MKNNRKGWQFERVHISTYAAVPLFSHNRKEIGSKSSDIHTAASLFLRPTPSLSDPLLMEVCVCIVPSSIARCSAHDCLNSVKKFNSNLPRPEFECKWSPPSGTVCFVMSYVSVAHSVPSHRQRMTRKMLLNICNKMSLNRRSNIEGARNVLGVAIRFMNLSSK